MDSYAFTTAYKIFIDFGIPKSTTCRYVRNGKLRAYMQGGIIKWYIIKDELFDDFIRKHRKY